ARRCQAVRRTRQGRDSWGVSSVKTISSELLAGSTSCKEKAARHAGTNLGVAGNACVRGVRVGCEHSACGGECGDISRRLVGGHDLGRRHLRGRGADIEGQEEWRGASAGGNQWCQRTIRANREEGDGIRETVVNGQ